ncbi:MAG TPA: PP2C family serine/threonine-protein phosphatase [Candidatus Deferrimicrobiaceae bacterium]
MPSIAAFGLTDIGHHRDNNEDVLLLMPEAGAFAVADGMGGPAFGEVAAAIFADTARRALSTNPPGTIDDAERLAREIFLIANRDILAYASEAAAREGMGCTAELLLVVGDDWLIGHVGDSRSYRFRGGELLRITKDHSLVQDQVDRGLLPEADARRHPMRNVILRAVGTAELIETDIHRGTLLPGDLILLCSDGLTDMADEAEIGALLAGPGPLPEKGKRLVDLALAAGGRDNVTVVLCERLQGG